MKQRYIETVNCQPKREAPGSSEIHEPQRWSRVKLAGFEIATLTSDCGILQENNS